MLNSYSGKSISSNSITTKTTTLSELSWKPFGISEREQPFSHSYVVCMYVCRMCIPVDELWNDTQGICSYLHSQSFYSDHEFKHNHIPHPQAQRNNNNKIHTDFTKCKMVFNTMCTILTCFSRTVGRCSFARRLSLPLSLCGNCEAFPKRTVASYLARSRSAKIIYICNTEMKVVFST